MSTTIKHVEAAIPPAESFVSRHVGPDENDVAEMLKTLGFQSLDALIDATIPQKIRLRGGLDLPKGMTEPEVLSYLRSMASKNQVFRSFIGMGYSDCITPPVIQRNILENPGWYTAYTPYQAEIAQGRLEALINYQTMVIDLTGMQIANASLLDEATSASEAMHLFYASRKTSKKSAHKFFVDQHVFAQTIDVLMTRSAPIGVELVIGDIDKLDVSDPELFAVMVQNPDSNGAVKDYSAFVGKAHANDLFVIMAADLMSLLLLKSPGEMGADAVVGSTQRFGVPMGFGGPHAAFFATRDEFKRQMPGRIIGASIDASGNHGYRMALQTREQHIRREKATSNICTAQVLLSVMAGMYAVYHGPEGLRKIAGRIHGLASALDAGLKSLGLKQVNEHYFDTLKVAVSDKAAVMREAEKRQINFRYFTDNHVGISLDETTSSVDCKLILETFAAAENKKASGWSSNGKDMNWPAALVRKSSYLTHPVFNTHHSEHEMLRYIKRDRKSVV